MTSMAKLLEARCKRDALELEYRGACLDVGRECQALQASGVRLRELGQLLGVSKQAVSQLVKHADEADRLEWLERQDAARFMRAVDRDRARSERGLVRGSFPCESCGKFRRRPADECQHCGSTPLTHHGNAANLNRAYGYAA